MAGHFLYRPRGKSVWRFRRRVPAAIQSATGPRAICCSLGTADRRQAVVRARSLAAQTDVWFNRLMAGKRKLERTGYTLTMPGIGISVTVDPNNPDDVREGNLAFAALVDKAGAQTPTQVAAAGAGAANTLLPAGTPQAAAKTLREAVEEFLLKHCRTSGTRRSYSYALDKVFLPYAGATMPMSSFGQEQFAAFAEYAFSDAKAVRGRAFKTRRGYVRTVQSLFTYIHARRPTIAAVLNSRTLLPPKPVSDDQDRDKFSDSDLAEIFKEVLPCRESNPSVYWVTLLSALSGGRLEELCQFHLHDDLKLHDSGTWVIDINERLDADGVKRKALKRVGSARFLPIHTKLVELGFVEFLQRQKSKGYGRPFEEWRPYMESIGKWSHRVSRDGCTFKDRLASGGRLPVAEKQAWFHSHRATVSTHLASRGVAEGERHALLGQRISGGEQGRYAKLKTDVPFLSALVETHLTGIVDILDQALRESPALLSPARRGRPRKRADLRG